MLKYTISFALFLFYNKDYYDFFVSEKDTWIVGPGALFLSASQYRYAIFCFANILLSLFTKNNANYYFYFTSILCLLFFIDLIIIKNQKKV